MYFIKPFDTVHRITCGIGYMSLRFLLSWELPQKVISKCKNNEGWTIDINFNIEIKQGFPLSLTLFGIYIDNIERCLEEGGCLDTILAGIVIILLLYADYIVLIQIMAKSHSRLDKQLRILKYFFSNMGMTVNIDKTKNMIIKSNKDTCDKFDLW